MMKKTCHRLSDINKKKFIKRVLLFLTSGGLAFVVDFACYVMLQAIGLEHRLARLVAYVVSTISAWFMNRHLTFYDANKAQPKKELMRYFYMAASSFVLNYGFYFLSTSYISFFANNNQLAFFIGIAISAIYNFIITNLFVYKK